MGEASETIINAELSGNADYPFPDSDILDWPSEQETRDDAERDQ